METLIHLSHEESPITIDNSGLFGGVFVGDNGGMGAPVTHYFTFDSSTIATHSDIEFHDNLDAAVRSLDVYDELNDEQIEQLTEVICENEQIESLDAETLEALFCGMEEHEADWHGQKLRGEVAKFLGFNGVEMNDETGISTLLLSGTSTLENPEDIAA